MCYVCKYMAFFVVANDSTIYSCLILTMALQQAVGLSAPSPRSCGLYSSIPNVTIGIPRFSIVFHWSFLLSASSFIGVTPSKSLSFCTAKVYGCGGNERVPASSLCPEKNNDDGLRCPNIFFVQNFSNSTFPNLDKP